LTKTVQPQGLDRHQVERLLSKTKPQISIVSRIEILSRHFLRRPYKSNPLIGSADTPEVFTTSVDGFDCVTYIETVLALARASTVDGFIERLRKMRYEKGRIQWDRRNHYMTTWIRNNVRERIIKPVSMTGIPSITKDRVLNVVPGLQPQRTRVRCLPKRELPRLTPKLRSADLIFFASTRGNLDVFHEGIIVRDDDRVLMRHASRSQGKVVEQELSDFVKANRMAGVIVVRPQ
jgi:hypothetical protein